jgi:AraC-like DNA-binding protein
MKDMLPQLPEPPSGNCVIAEIPPLSRGGFKATWRPSVGDTKDGEIRRRAKRRAPAAELQNDFGSALGLAPQRCLGDPDTRMTVQSLGVVAAARLAHALDLVATRFADPELNVLAIARVQNISPRYLQRLFEATGRSFTDHVKELRLQHAFQACRDPDNNRPIVHVALEAGFSDISYFNRLFRARFGDTPSGVRKRQGA